MQNFVCFLKNKTDVFILVLASLIISSWNYVNFNGFSITFSDTDDYMRIIRILEFFKNYDLTNNLIIRSNVPFGCELHWTRFYDIFIIIPSYLLNFFIKNIRESVIYVCFFITPLIKIGLILTAYNIAKKITTKYAAFIIGIIISAHPLLIPYTNFGRPDHHAFIMLFIMIFIYFLATANEKNFKKYYIQLGLFTAISVWISPETLIPLLISDFILLIFALKDSSLSLFLFKKNTLISLFIFPLIFSPQGVLIEYDRISIVHFSLYTMSALFFRVLIAHKNEKLKSKLPFLCCFLIILASLFLVLYPKFFYGMAADVPEVAKKYWLNQVGEMMSPFSHKDGLFYIFHTLIIFSCAGIKIFENLQKDSFFIFWSVFIAITLCYTILGGFSYRMLPLSSLFSIFLITDVCFNSKITIKISKTLKILWVFLISPCLLFILASVEQDDNENQEYSKKELYKLIDNLDQNPSVIIAKESYGPEILFYTKHNILAAPYHRQTSGIMNACYILDDFKEKRTKKILNLTNANYILKISDENPKKFLKHYQKKYLQKIDIPKKFSNVFIWKVLRNKNNELL